MENGLVDLTIRETCYQWSKQYILNLTKRVDSKQGTSSHDCWVYQ